MGMKAVSVTWAASASSKWEMMPLVKVAESISSISQGIRLRKRRYTGLSR
ncbi:hypothetical protein [Oscillibacter sp. CAG:155]|nr:hypothetical protein [Oscillibacter sp. CAG:155]